MNCNNKDYTDSFNAELYFKVDFDSYPLLQKQGILDSIRLGIMKHYQDPNLDCFLFEQQDGLRVSPARKYDPLNTEMNISPQFECSSMVINSFQSKEALEIAAKMLLTALSINQRSVSDLAKSAIMGLLGEITVMLCLAEQGFTLLGNRLHSRCGEIDILAAQNHEFFAIEVKTRSELSYDHLDMDMIFPTGKRAKILATIQLIYSDILLKWGDAMEFAGLRAALVLPQSQYVEVQFYDWC